MKYVVHDKIGNPADVLLVKDAPAKILASGEVRVKVLATPIHPANLLQIAGQYGVAPNLPAIPGGEGIGRIAETADDVTNLNVGQRVMLAGGNTWQEEIVGPAAQFIPLPDAGDVEQLSMLTVNPITALLMLTRFVDLKPGDWIIQSAANSAVGEYVIQLAKQRGLKSVNIVRRESLIDNLKALGADVVLVDGPDLPERIAESTENAPISLAIEAVGGETFTHLIQSLTYQGTLVSYGVLSMQLPTLPLQAVIFNDVRIKGFWLSKWFETASDQDKQAAFGEIIPLVVSGTIKAKIDSRFSLDEIQEAVNRAAAPGRDGKVLLIPNADV